uniref:DRBM domain-containing protein n=1 Tax=Timema tahoe TaxID=61484 RepID=A0A7R9IL72_9NEOP|nr:unnamed protein product [Timema tahoe]
MIKMADFDCLEKGPKHRQRFLCELCVEGFDYVGAGNSTSKKDAQFNASRDFVQYLVRQGIVKASDLPEDATGISVGDAPSGDGSLPDGGPLLPGGGATSRPVFQPGMGPNEIGEAYRPYQGSGDNKPFSYIDRIAEQKKVEEAEDYDVNASIHGNWTLENAKARLNQFLQVHKITAEYKYTVVGPDHTRGRDENVVSWCCSAILSRCPPCLKHVVGIGSGILSFVSEMSFFVNKLGRNISARETGSNKQSASRSCALSLVRQLFHLGVIEAFTGTLKKSKEEEQMKPYPVSISPDLSKQIFDVLDALQINPTIIVSRLYSPRYSLSTTDRSYNNFYSFKYGLPI